ncbi:putative Mak10 subunit NatC N(alpha) terminal acetyltransferase [Trypanosoma vivax]|nr:hypothetical protein TRVL_03302 [Trypanosoma vivax]KAH8620589.1 putative Mak10 subunit NatC N(alpha) terminal acetyltransferase [Trypanosoma vivax]
MACDLDETWTECLSEFKGYLAANGTTWRCESLATENKEAMLSAPEVMDPKTDPGCGYDSIHSLNSLLKQGDIPSAATLNGQALIDIMDIILSKELQYLQGYSLTAGCLSFPYFFRMDLLKEQNFVLHAYCRGVVRTVELVMRAVVTTRIRSDEEFVPWIKGMQTDPDATEEQILDELEEAARTAESEAVAIRLRFRREFLNALKLFIFGRSKSDVEGACSASDAASELLNSAGYARTVEPVQDSRFFREAEVGYWTSVFTPTKCRPILPFAETMQAYITMLRQLASLRDLFTLPSLQALIEFAESIGAQEPLLPMRSITVIVLLCNDPSETFLYGPPMCQRVLEDLSANYGATLYLGIFEGKEDLLDGVVNYRIHKTMRPNKLSHAEPQIIRQQTIEAVRLWAMEMSKAYLIYIESVLCNRGLAHRRLMNSMKHLCELQEVSYTTDSSIFLSFVPGVERNMCNDVLRRMLVLSLYANQHVLRVVEQIVSLTLELDLFTQGEMLPALWSLVFTLRIQFENLSLLGPLAPSSIPETRINRVTGVPLHNLCLSTRTAGSKDIVHQTILEAGHLIANATFVCACVMEIKGLIDLTSQPKHSLITVENAFNHRLRCLWQMQNPPFTSYARCLEAKRELLGTVPMDDERLLKLSQTARSVAENAADKLKKLLLLRELGSPRKRALESRVHAMEQTARSLSASLATFMDICKDEDKLKDFTAKFEHPFHPSMICLSLQRKTTQ